MSITCYLNYIKSTGVCAVEAIYEYNSVATAVIEVFSGSTKISEKQSTGNGLISVRQNISLAGSITVKTRLYDTNNQISDEIVREIDVTDGTFGDTLDISLGQNRIFGKSKEVGLQYILGVDVDRLLAPSFEVHGVVPPNNAKRYDGWEKKGANNWVEKSNDEYTLAGHSLGHWLSAAAVFYRDTKNVQIFERMNYAVEKLDELQKTTRNAYIGGCEETCFTRLFDGGWENNEWVRGFWVPWYGIHKIYQGLIDVYDYTENPTAFIVLKRFADWAMSGLSALTDVQMQTVLDVEYGGMNEVFAKIYEMTASGDYLLEARRFTHDRILNPLAEKNDCLTGNHANTQIPKIIGAAKMYEQDKEKYKTYRTACENFWDMVVNNRSYAIGGNSIAEHFEAKGAESLGVKTCESCNTYNMMRLCEYLFSWNKTSEYMDWYENALFNHILGQQEPKTGAKMYFVSLLQGHHRVYEDKYKSWWCCTGTGMENPGRYTRCQYFEDFDSLYINLYMESSYKWENKGIELETVTDYPYSGNVKIKVKSGRKRSKIKFRVPGWVDGEFLVCVGSEKYSASSGGYLIVDRVWEAGEKIEVTIPMKVRTYESRIKNQIVFMYGPLVLAGVLGDVTPGCGAKEYISNETKIDTVTADTPYLVTNGKEISSLVQKAGDVFKICAENISDGREIILKPFFEVSHSFYTVYWNVDFDADEYEKKLNSIQTDRVEPDGQQDEIGHSGVFESSYQGYFVSGSKTYYYREAYGSDKAFFAYNMAVRENKDNFLFVRYWGSDGDLWKDGKIYKREFDIYADGKNIAHQVLKSDRMENIYDVFYKIPSETVKGKDSIEIKFKPYDNQCCAGRVLEIRTVTQKID